MFDNLGMGGIKPSVDCQFFLISIAQFKGLIEDSIMSSSLSVDLKKHFYPYNCILRWKDGQTINKLLYHVEVVKYIIDSSALANLSSALNHIPKEKDIMKHL